MASLKYNYTTAINTGVIISLFLFIKSPDHEYPGEDKFPEK